MDGQLGLGLTLTKWRRKLAEDVNRLSRAQERYRQTTDRQTDGTAIAYSERERELTFAKNCQNRNLYTYEYRIVLCASGLYQKQYDRADHF